MGIDLAAKSTRPTGVALLDDDTLIARTCTLYEDADVLSHVAGARLAAIDAPLSVDSGRPCDRLLKKYGTMPLVLPPILALARRGIRIAKALRAAGHDVIEVFPTATAKILGFFRPDKLKMRVPLRRLGVKIVPQKVTIHELDAVLAAYTGLLYLRGLARPVGDERGAIVVPSISRS